jgi:hypothetical protein
MTIRIPDGKHERLRRLAESQGVSLNKLVEEWAGMALAQIDAETRFAARAARGDAGRGLAVLEKLDRSLAGGGGGGGRGGIRRRGAKAMSKRHKASSIDDFLKDEGIFEEAQSQPIKEVVAWQLANAMNKEKVVSFVKSCRLNGQSQSDRPGDCGKG